MKIKKVLLAVAVAALTYSVATAAFASEPETIEVSWITSLAPGVTVPHGSNDVTWPQEILTSDSPTCGIVIQKDKYKNFGKFKALVDALIAHGTLNKPGSPDWTDGQLLVSPSSFAFVVLPACEETTPPASSTPPETSPPVTTTPPASTTPPVSTPPVSSPATSHRPSSSSSRPVPSRTSSKPAASSSAPRRQLATTGLDSDQWYGIGGLLVGLGALALWAGLQRKRGH